MREKINYRVDKETLETFATQFVTMLDEQTMDADSIVYNNPGAARRAVDKVIQDIEDGTLYANYSHTIKDMVIESVLNPFGAYRELCDIINRLDQVHTFMDYIDITNDMLDKFTFRKNEFNYLTLERYCYIYCYFDQIAEERLPIPNLMAFESSLVCAINEHIAKDAVEDPEALKIPIIEEELIPDDEIEI